MLRRTAGLVPHRRGAARGVDVPLALERLDAALDLLGDRPEAGSAAVTVECWQRDGEPVPPAAALAGADFRRLRVGSAWGRPWGTSYLRLRGSVPPAWAGGTVELVLDLGFTAWPPGFQAEGLLIDASGRPLRGLHPRQRHVLIGAPVAGCEAVEVLVEAAANPSVTSFTRGGAGAVNGREPGPVQRLVRAELVLADEPARELAADLDLLRSLLRVREHLGTPPERVARVVAAANAACDLLGDGRPGSDAWARGIAAARAVLAPVLRVPATPDSPRLVVVGHAHLDTAWLWPVRETVRKAVRTYANVIALMRDDPELTFAGSQAAQHDWVRMRHPELWAEVAGRAREGRWIPVGGMWVESDVLLPSGESLARQLIHGQRFFLKHFGRAARTGWLPDCFGYSPALPQLLRHAGIDAFVTQKLSWNDTNRFPHRTFWWEGLDGSRVLTHFPSVDTYNAELSSHDLERATRPQEDAGPPAVSLVPLGYGDGGGGPTRAMAERVRRMRDVSGLPRTAFGDPDAFFAELDRRDLPTWRGDLYLETHRGVWTSQRETKLGDAAGDEALRQAEAWAATAAVTQGRCYPAEELDRLWQRHLLLEFHDILPGSSISRVHREAEAEHAAVLSAALHLRDEAIAALRADGPPSDEGRAAAPRPSAAPDRQDTDWVLDNGLLRARVGPHGTVVSLLDLRSGHDLVPPGLALGELRLHADEPTVFDAWNIDRSYAAARLPLPPPEQVTTIAHGIAASVAFGRSRTTWAWSLPPDEACLRLRLDVDWHESERLLRLAIPLDLRAAHLSAGVQHGLLERSLHANTSWEQARYEDWFQGYLHVAQADVGVAVVTAHCHGYDASSLARPDGGTATSIGLSLVRGPTFPDPDCDQGRHSFVVDLLVGCDLDQATRAARGARAALIPDAAMDGLQPVVQAAGRGVMLDAVKLADDDTGDVVVRLHEAIGGRTTASLRSTAPLGDPRPCDLLEHPTGEPYAARDGGWDIPVRPFELRTLRFPRG